MGEWIGRMAGLALIGLVLWGIVRVAGGRTGRRGGGLQAMAALLMGFGAPFDPPQRHVAETRDDAARPSPGAGEPL